MPKPSPWKEKSSPGPFREEHAFAESALPPNSIPFINRLKEVLDEARTNSLETVAIYRTLKDKRQEEAGWKARALLWVLNAQYFGQLAMIDMSREWDELDKAHKAGKF
jgi:hypothetical protein